MLFKNNNNAQQGWHFGYQKMRKQTNEMSCSEDTGSQESRGSNWKSTGECLK